METFLLDEIIALFTSIINFVSPDIIRDLKKKKKKKGTGRGEEMKN